mgnify:CR=1 FL=1
MRRVLVILSGEIDGPVLRSRCGALESAGAIALCYQLPDNAGLEQGLTVQRRLTQLLRATLGPAAEAVPIFIATDRDGERTADLADAWGATEVDR